MDLSLQNGDSAFLPPPFLQEFFHLNYSVNTKPRAPSCLMALGTVQKWDLCQQITASYPIFFLLLVLWSEQVNFVWFPISCPVWCTERQFVIHVYGRRLAPFRLLLSSEDLVLLLYLSRIKDSTVIWSIVVSRTQSASYNDLALEDFFFTLAVCYIISTNREKNQFIINHVFQNIHYTNRSCSGVYISTACSNAWCFSIYDVPSFYYQNRNYQLVPLNLECTQFFDP